MLTKVTVFLFSLGFLAASAGFVQASEEALVVFVQPQAEVDAAFISGWLPAADSLAQSLGIELKTIEVEAGVPEGIDLTPLFVYQNHLGRSVYQGRWKTLGRLRNFVRTSRSIPQGEALLDREGVLVSEVEAMKVVASLKITEPAGSPPENFDYAQFLEKSRAAIATGAELFEQADQAQLTRTDRTFYMDYYPFVADDGTFSVRTALFSEFHCKESIYESAEAFSAPWDLRAEAFAKATLDLERAIGSAMNETEYGDGFTPVAASVARVSWDDLGLELPPAPQRDSRNSGGVKLVQKWTVGYRNAMSPILFRFPPPLDKYTGEATEVSGSLQLSEDFSLATVAAAFEVETSSVSMGEKDLTAMVRGPNYLKMKAFPKAVFAVESVSSDARPLEFGRLSNCEVQGTLTIKGLSVPVTLRAQVEPFVEEDGKPALDVKAAFTLNTMKPWKFVGPLEGIPPANETLLFDINLVMIPAE